MLEEIVLAHSPDESAALPGAVKFQTTPSMTLSVAVEVTFQSKFPRAKDASVRFLMGFPVTA